MDHPEGPAPHLYPGCEQSSCLHEGALFTWQAGESAKGPRKAASTFCEARDHSLVPAQVKAFSPSVVEKGPWPPFPRQGFFPQLCHPSARGLAPALQPAASGSPLPSRRSSFSTSENATPVITQNAPDALWWARDSSPFVLDCVVSSCCLLPLPRSLFHPAATSDPEIPEAGAFCSPAG